MIFHTFNGDGAIHEPAPIYAFQLHWLKRDQHRFRIRRRTLKGLNWLGLWTALLVIGLNIPHYVVA